MRNRGEYYFTLSINDRSEIQGISDLCSVDGTDGRSVVCYANQQQYEKLLAAGYQPHLMTPPSMLEEAKMWDGSDRAAYAWDSYPTYSAYQSMMEAFPSSAVSGRTCTLMTLGTLSSGRKIMGVRINNGSPDGKPKFLYSSTIHGDETTGWILMLRLIDELCTSADSRIVNLVNNLDIFIFPNANPDGTYYGGNNSVTGARRANANGIDMNRNYADPHGGPHPDGHEYQTETQWFMDFAAEIPFVMAANYHGGAEVMNYPWDNTYTLHADDAWYQFISHEYADLTHEVNSNYMTDYNNGVTNGAQWYMIGGGRQDYMNGYAQCRELTIECSNSKLPSGNQLPNFWNYNKNSIFAYMAQCIYGIHGVVTDSITGQPLEATITISGHDDQYSFVESHLPAGDFHRPIKGGVWTVIVSKDGYCPKLVEVKVDDYETYNLDVQLVPGNCMVASFSASTTQVAIGGHVNFTDGSFGNIVAWNWTFEGGTPSTSTQQNPSNITYNEAGDFAVTLTITDAEGNSETLTREDYIHVREAYNMQDGTVTTCSALFYDNGGPNSNYSNNKDYTMTFRPAEEGNMIRVNFVEFSTEANYDFLYIYDGTSTNAPQIGTYDGSNSPGEVTATNAEGALTFRFTSDYYSTSSGWVATVSCAGDWSVTEDCCATVVYPNPNNGSFTINVKGAFSYRLYNSIGQQVLSGEGNGATRIDASGLGHGVYFLQLTDDHTRVEKLVIEK
jgi:PKD repeat protein